MVLRKMQWCVAAALIAMAGGAAAQQPLSLQDAASRAVLANPEVLAKWHTFEAAAYERKVSFGAYLPTLDAVAAKGRENLNDPLDSTAPRFSYNNVSLVLRQMLFDGFATPNDVKRLDHARRVRYYELLDVSESAALEAVRAYQDVLRYQALVGYAEENYGAIDVVYANAGIEWTKDVRHTALAEWRRVIDVNLTGVFLLTRAAMQRMCDAAKGSIIVTSSPHALATVPDAGAYAASKGGVHALVRALALEGAPFQVRVNGIVPGTIDTPMVRREAQAAKDPDHQMVLMAATHPLNRLGRPEEVANLALFLASPLAEFITGSLISVDGGLMATLPSGPPLSYNN